MRAGRRTSSSFTTAGVTTTFSLFSGSTTPTTIDSGDAQAIEVGVKFGSDVDGFLTDYLFKD